MRAYTGIASQILYGLYVLQDEIDFNILFNQSIGAIKGLKEVLKWKGFRIVATVEQGGTKINPLSDKDCCLLSQSCLEVV